jgi:hypothetical protein
VIVKHKCKLAPKFAICVKCQGRKEKKERKKERKKESRTEGRNESKFRVIKSSALLRSESCPISPSNYAIGRYVTYVPHTASLNN